MEFYTNKQTVTLLSLFLLFTLPLIIVIIFVLSLAYISSLIQRSLKNYMHKIKTKYHILMHKIKKIYQSYLQDIIKALSFNFCIILITIILIEWITVDSRELKNIIEVCIPFIAAIIGLSIPFGVEMVNKINEKYNSTSLVKGFKGENAYLSFFTSILVCIGSSLIWILSEHFEGLNYTVLFLPHKLLLVSTLLLFIGLFWFMYLIMLYYQPKKLAARYLNFAKCPMNYGKYLPMIKDLTVYSLNNINDEMQLKLLNFWAIKAKSNNEKTEEGQKDFYNLIYEINDAMASNTKKQFRTTKQSILFVFLDTNHILSDKTYDYIQFGILQYIFYGRIDLYKSYWQQAHQYVEYYLRGIEDNVIKRRERFKDFHF